MQRRGFWQASWRWDAIALLCNTQYGLQALWTFTEHQFKRNKSFFNLWVVIKCNLVDFLHMRKLTGKKSDCCELKRNYIWHCAECKYGTVPFKVPLRFCHLFRLWLLQEICTTSSLPYLYDCSFPAHIAFGTIHKISPDPWSLGKTDRNFQVIFVHIVVKKICSNFTAIQITWFVFPVLVADT